jgi:60 kDa SS-A/Ro ribonucleoprotein
MQRFLILGSEGGTYYVGEKQLTKDACDATMRCIEADGLRAVEMIKMISHEGRTAKNDYALFALAMATGEGDTCCGTNRNASIPLRWLYGAVQGMGQACQRSGCWMV